MPYRREGSFANWLQERGEAGLLSPQDVAHFISNAASALQYAHNNSIVHQDVKPSNFLIRTNLEDVNHPDLLLADFGIAKLSSATASVSHSIRGTPTYMAPEQWDGEPVYATDQYALAVLAYELLTGRAPFVGRQQQVMYQHLTVQPQPPSTLNPLLSKDVDAVLLKALKKKPEERFKSISAFANAFREALQSTDASTIVRTPHLPESGNLHATLAISKTEAQTGTRRILTLPDGRQVVVTVPPSAYDGQVLHLSGMGNSGSAGRSAGGLIITLFVQDISLPPTITNLEQTVPASNSNLVEAATSPLNSGTMVAAAQPSPVTPNVSGPSQKIFQRSAFFNAKVLGPVTLALLVLLASVSFFYFRGGNQSGNSNIDVAATTHANDATAFASNVNATTQANSATSTAQANNAVATAQATNATATAITSNTNPYPPRGATLVLNDPLSGQDANQWSVDTECAFTGGSFHASVHGTDYFGYCGTSAITVSNFAYEVQMSIVRGDYGGIVFYINSASSTAESFYSFRIGTDSSYGLFIYKGTGGLGQQLQGGTSSTINTGLNQSNVIAVVATNNNFDLYVNKQFIVSVKDSTYNSGYIGVIAVPRNSLTEVAFSNAKVWRF
jgi:eukaryotic-like serine/threonine-protein kinase